MSDSHNILISSIRSCVGQIKKANEARSPSSWGSIEVAADKLLAAADTFERRHTCDVAQTAPVNAAALTERLIEAAVSYEHAEGIYSRPARQELSEARAAVEAAIGLRAATIEECAKLIEPKQPRPCDCDRCDCGNRGDAEAVAAWDADAYNAKAIRALAAQPPAAPVETKRKTFTIPPGHEAVRYSEGRATGEVRPRSSAGSEGEPFMMLSCREAKQCLHNIPGCICDGDPTNG